MLERATAKGHLSVRLSVKLVSHAHTVQDIEILFTTYDRAMFPVSCRHISQTYSGLTPNECVKGRYSYWMRKFEK